MKFPKITCPNLSPGAWGAIAGLGTFAATNGAYALKCLLESDIVKVAETQLGDLVEKNACENDGPGTFKLGILALTLALATWQTLKILPKMSFFASKETAPALAKRQVATHPTKGM